MQMLCVVPNARTIAQGNTARRRIGHTAGRAECAVAAAAASCSGIGAHVQAQLLVATERIGHGVVEQRTSGGLLITLDGIVTLQFQSARLRGRTIQVRRIDILQGEGKKVPSLVATPCTCAECAALLVTLT